MKIPYAKIRVPGSRPLSFELFTAKDLEVVGFVVELTLTTIKLAQESPFSRVDGPPMYRGQGIFSDKPKKSLYNLEYFDSYEILKKCTSTQEPAQQI